MILENPLVRAAIYGAFGVSAFGLLVKYRIQYNIRNSLCYKEALKCLCDHPEAQKQLGQPIKDFRINIGDQIGNNAKDDKIWYTVPVKGPKSKGSMTYYVTKVDEADRNYKVTRIELDLDHIKDRKLLIKNEFM